MGEDDAAKADPRAVVLDSVLRGSSLLGWGFFIVAAATTWDTFHVLFSYGVVPLVLITVLAWSGWGTTNARAAGLISLLTLLAIVGFVRVGLLPGNWILAMMAVILASVFLGRRAALLLLGLVVVAALAIGAAYQQGALTAGAPRAADPNLLGNWARMSVIFVLTASCSVLAIVYLLSRLDAMLAESKRLVDEVREAQARQSALEAERLEVEKTMAAAHKLDALGRLAGGVAHDYRNSLAVVRGWLDLIRADDDPETLREGLDAIDVATTASTELTQRLIAIARREIAAPTHVDLTSLVRGSLQTLGRVLASTAEVDERLTPVPYVLVDRGQAERVLLNLILNGRDAMPEGGTLVVETYVIAAKDTPKTAADRSRDHVVVAVSDTGRGFDAEAQGHIFEPFFASRGPGGKGLGLAMVHAVVAQAGGYVAVESEVDRGSRFLVAFPVAAAPPAVLPASAGGASDADDKDALTTSAVRLTPSLRALVVEDEPAVAETTSRMLETLGYTALRAATADEAVALLEKSGLHIDLVCTDGRMPGMRVTTFIEVMRARWPNVPLLVCTGYMDEDLFAKQTAERFAVLAKPFGVKELEETIAVACARRGVVDTRAVDTSARGAAG